MEYKIVKADARDDKYTLETGVEIEVIDDNAKLAGDYYFSPAKGSDGKDYELRWSITKEFEEGELNKDESDMCDWDDLTTMSAVTPPAKTHCCYKCICVNAVTDAVSHVSRAKDFVITDFPWEMDALNCRFWLVYINEKSGFLHLVNTFMGKRQSGFHTYKASKKDIKTIKALAVGDPFPLKGLFKWFPSW